MAESTPKSIIRSFLDIDFYILTMAQLVWKRWFNVSVKYAFKNRTTKMKLAQFIGEQELRQQLDWAKNLCPTPSDLVYLRESQSIPRGFFCEGFLDFLRTVRLSDYSLKRVYDDYEITFGGKWIDAIWWETMALAIVNELYFRELLKRLGISLEEAWAEGEYRLLKKIEALRDSGAGIIEFGTRRRFSGSWQDHVVKRIFSEISKNCLGTSNVYVAKNFNLRPMGTLAHQLDMVCAGLEHDSDIGILAAHQRVLQHWWDLYGEPLSIALPDTFGTDFFFRDFTRQQALNWRGVRQDSGDPFAFGEKAIDFYRSLSIDPKSKIIVFSDGLETDKIIALRNRFSCDINVAFGWGTNLTNDLGFSPLSLVVKPIEANGKPLVKLSDNLAKATGNLKEIERYRKIFGHRMNIYEECKY